MGKADLHIHSTASDGLASVPEILEHVEAHTDLDLIAIADHDMLEGSLEARELAAHKTYRFQVMVGVEITTLEGHLLAYDIEKPIRMLQPLARTIERVAAQGGFCVIPHPMSWLTRSLGQRGIRRLLSDPHLRAVVWGIEVFNPSLAGRVTYRKAMALNRREFGLGEFAGSDAHLWEHIGRSYTVFPGRNADDFRRALREGTTEAQGELLGWAEHRQMLSSAGEQLWRSLVLLPRKHIRRALRGLTSRQGR
ncbi:MAG: phosphotransferase [Chloroflexi bacterium]|nr:phosphotransferase [Chloroflexota bacterium]